MPFDLIYFHRNYDYDISGGEFLFYYCIPFALTLFYFIHKYFKNRNRVVNWKRGRIPAGFQVNETNIAEVFIALASAISKRGKSYTVQKEERIIAWINEHFPNVNHRADESYYHALRNAMDITNIVAWCAKHLTENQKLGLFEFLEEIAFVYDDVNDEEVEMIDYIYGKFKIPFEDLSERTKHLFNRQTANENPKVSTNFKRKNSLSCLGLSDPVQLSEIKKTYRALVKKIHPDKFPDASPAEKAFYKEQFQEVQAAYDYLLAQESN